MNKNNLQLPWLSHEFRSGEVEGVNLTEAVLGSDSVYVLKKGIIWFIEGRCETSAAEEDC